MTIVPVEYPTQDDLERLALINKLDERNLRIFKKVAKFVLLPIALVFTALLIAGYMTSGILGVVQVFAWGGIAVFFAVFLLFKLAIYLMMAAMLLVFVSFFS